MKATTSTPTTTNIACLNPHKHQASSSINALSLDPHFHFKIHFHFSSSFRGSEIQIHGFNFDDGRCQCLFRVPMF